ncbi:MAG: hypothetical protein HC816_01180 [Leptolyngbyaceae cyanobacterium RM1_1_2]|nr:hypothetical protein [Leptolyngbyaceae cyanobacterium RM1_1_2]
MAGGNDYVVSVKKNQGKLYRQLETIVRYRQPRQTALTPFECHHGRQEQRLVSVYSAQGIDPQHWQGAKTILCVERRRITINLLRLYGFKSVTSALRELANQVEKIFRLLQ